MENAADRKSDNFEEVETRLEKMFAGIEDESSSKELDNLEEIIKPKDDTDITKCLAQELEAEPRKEPPPSKDIEPITPSLPPQPEKQQEEQQQQQQQPQHQHQLQPQTNKNQAKKQSSDNVSKKKKPAKKDSKLFKPMIKTEKKNKNDTSRKDENNFTKIKGPYIQIKADNTIFVNNSSSEEYLENKAKKVNSNSVKSEISKLKGLFVSTLGTKYDADTTDISWLCVFCKKGPHKMGLGDLYGPYIIQSCEDLDVNGEFKPMTYQMNASNPIINVKKKKHEKMESPKPIISTGMLQVSDNSFEVWCHEDCIIWAAGVYLIGLKLIGLENAVWSSSFSECSKCMLNGAIVCCLSRGCSKKAHFPCAKISEWVLDESNFKTFCPEHNTM